MARLILKGEDGKEQTISGVTSIGRLATNDIVVPEDRVSRHHARVIPTGKSFVVEDLQSSNGTYLNNVRVERKLLRDGDVIRVGGMEFTFKEDKALALEGQLLGNYRILKKIGTGGMGAVYRALQVTMDREVAVKVLRQDLTANPSFVKRFMAEAKLAGSLNHENVIRVHDFGEAMGTYYMVMELIEGETVGDILQREGKIAVERAVDIVLQVARALEHSEKHKLLHLDIKPHNVVIDRKGVAKLADMGLARPIGVQVDARHGPIMGTPHYMSPEQGRREHVDIRSDVYSLGVTFFHMITGRVPFDGPNSLAVITKHINQPPPSPREYDLTVPEPVCRLVTRMLAKNPHERPGTAAALVMDLTRLKEEVAEEFKKAARRRKSAEAIPTARPRKKAGSGVGVFLAILALLVVAGGGAAAWFAVGRPTGSRLPNSLSRSKYRKTLDGIRAAEKAKDLLKAVRLLDELSARAPTLDGRRDARRRKESLELRLHAADERNASRELGDINRLPAVTDAERAASAEHLRALLRRYPETTAAMKAREMLVAMGEVRAPAAAETERPSWQELSAEVESLRDRNELAPARRKLVRFLALDPPQNELIMARKLLDQLEVELSSLEARAVDEARRRLAVKDYAGALRALGEARGGAESAGLRKEIEEEATASAERVLEEAEGLLRSLKLSEAKTLLKAERMKIAGCSSEAALAARMEQIRAVEKLFASLNELAPTGRLRAKVAGSRSAIVHIGEEGVSYRSGAAQRTATWKDLAPDEVRRVLLELAPKAHEAAGVVMAFLGEKKAAREELSKAVEEGSASAGRWLEEVDRSARAYSYDFSQWQQVGDWEVRGGRWSVSHGVLVQSDDLDAKLFFKRARYLGQGFELKLRFMVRSGAGLVEVGLWQDSRNAATVVMSEALSASVVAAGAAVSEKREWRFKMGTTHLVEMSCSGGRMRVRVDGADVAELLAPGLAEIQGRVLIHTFGVTCSFDDIQMRQGE